MENVPKIVRERLKVAMVTVDHPDADVLTAFAERSLQDVERTTVLEHLAHCGECREIVALALPSLQAAEMPLVPSRRRWFTWPVLRWGFALAGVVVIVSLAIVQRHNQSSSPTTAYKAAQPAANEARNQTLPVIPEPEPAAKKKGPAAFIVGKTVDTEKLPSRDSGSAAASGVNSRQVAGGAGFSGGVPSHGPRVANQANQFQQQNTNALAGASFATPVPSSPTAKQQINAQLVANTPVPASQEMQGSSAQVNTQVQNFDLKTEAISDQPSTYGHAEEKVGRAKEPPDTVVHIETEKSLAGPARSDNIALAYSLPNTRWVITPAGGLQRSLDQGKSWQDVNVTTMPAPAAANFEIAARSSLAKAKDSAKEDKNENGAMVFHAVAANGLEVWAGGSAGQLYHSTDSGNHWSRVVPSAGGTVLTGDVVVLDFADAQHGRVSTSTSEVWTTSDDGLTWQKQ